MQEKVIIAICSIIASGIISFIVGYYLGKRNTKYQEYLRASKEFRDAFVPAMIELDEIRDIRTEGYSQGDFPSDIIQRHFDKHETAIKKFVDFLSEKDEKELVKSWEDYAYPSKELATDVSDNDMQRPEIG